MTTPNRDRYTPKQFATEILKIKSSEYVRQMCNRRIDKRTGKISQLPKGWVAEKIGKQWFISEVLLPKSKTERKSSLPDSLFKQLTHRAVMRDLTDTRNQIDEALNSIIGADENSRTPETIQDWEDLDFQVSAELEVYEELAKSMVSRLSSYWWVDSIWTKSNQESRNYHPKTGDVPASLHHYWWNSWRHLNPLSRITNHPQQLAQYIKINQNRKSLNLQGPAVRTRFTNDNDSKVPPPLKRAWHLITTIQRCYQFATINNQKIRIELTFDGDGSWEWTLKQPLDEPPLFIGLCGNKAPTLGKLAAELVDQILSKLFESKVRESKKLELKPAKPKKTSFCRYCANKLSKSTQEDKAYCNAECKQAQHDWRNKTLKRANRWNQKGKLIVEYLSKLQKSLTVLKYE